MDKRKIKERDRRVRLGIGAWMRAERERLGLTQKQIARYLQISPQTLGRYESGRHSPTIDTVWLLSCLPGASLGRLEESIKRQLYN